MKKIFTLIFILSCFFTSFGAYLENIPLQLTQPNGEVLNLFMTGDEFYSTVHDSDGYSIVQGSDGWYYYALYDAVNDQLIPSEFAVTMNRNFDLPMDKKLSISKAKYMEIRRAFFEPTGCNAAGVRENSLSKDLAKSKTAQQMNNLVICIGFSDTQNMTNSYDYVNGLFNTNEDNNMRDYFLTMSYDKVDVVSHFYPPADGSILRFYKDSHPRAYYEPYSSTNTIGYQEWESTDREHTLLQDAVNWVNANWPVPTNLNLDVNNDGDCDFISFVIVGEPGAWASLLWPHKWSLYYYDVYINGKQVWDYNFELDGSTTYFSSNVFCHEGYHVLGAPDLYHYYEYKDRKAANTWDIMDYSYLTKPQSMSAYMKYAYGNWVTSLPVATVNYTYEVFPFYFNDGSDPEKQVIYRIPMTGTNNQYSVVEYRKKQGTNYDLYLPDEGFLIYRINSSFWGNADFDGYSEFDELFLYRPESTQSGGVYTNGNLDGAPYNPGNGRTAFNSTTDPKPCQSNGTAENTQNINNILYDSTTDSYTFFYGDPANRNISVNQNTVILDGNSGSFGNVSISSNVVWNVTIPPAAAGWLNVSQTKGLNSKTITFTALNANSTGAPRTATATITGNGQTFTVTITQNANLEEDCALFEDIEHSAWGGTGSSSYANRTVTDDLGAWSVSAITNMTANSDRFLDARSARFRGSSADAVNLNRVEMLFDKPNGLGTVSFFYASYSTHSGGVIYLDYSTDQGVTWNNVGSVTAPSWSEGGEVMQEASFNVDIAGEARIRIYKNVQSGSTSVNIDNICITDYEETNTVSAPTFNPAGGNYLNPVDVTINCNTAGATIHYTTDGSTPTTSSPVFSTPVPISITTTLKAIAVKSGMENSAVSLTTYNFPIPVNNIAEFKAANTPVTNSNYRITGDVTFVFKSGRNIYVKDNSGGLLIYDDATPVITHDFNEGDVISGGVVGTCTMYNGLYEMIPVLNTASGVPGNPVEPIVVSMENLLADFYTYESQLIRIENIVFDEGTFGTGNDGNIPIHQDDLDMICRNHYGNITDYTTNPEIPYTVVGFTIPYNADRQIAPRNLDDIFPYEELDTYIITASVNNSNFGSISPSGEVYVVEGGSKTFTITAFDNYKIEDVLVNGESKGAISTYTFENVQSDGTIYAIFETVGIDNHEFENVLVYSHQNTVYIKNNEEVTITSVEIFDIMGRVVYGSYEKQIDTVITLSVSPGIYYVRLISQEGSVIAKKLAIMK